MVIALDSGLSSLGETFETKIWSEGNLRFFLKNCQLLVGEGDDYTSGSNQIWIK